MLELIGWIYYVIYVILFDHYYRLANQPDSNLVMAYTDESCICQNDAADRTKFKITMDEVHMFLREGWYGTSLCFHHVDDIDENNRPRNYKSPVKCHNLVKTVIDWANKKFIPMCLGL